MSLLSLDFRTVSLTGPFFSGNDLTGYYFLLVVESKVFIVLLQDSSGKNSISTAPSAAHVRIMRKGSTDHLALNIDAESQHLINTESDDEKGRNFLFQIFPLLLVFVLEVLKHGFMNVR